MALDPKRLKPSSNIDVLNAIRNEAGLQYQARVPEATKANVKSTMQALMEYQPAKNEFIETLVNRIGLEVFRYNSWTNPLAVFKKGMLPWGDTIEEIQVGLLNAKRYSPDREYMEKDLFGIERPDVQTNFHRINRQDQYKLTVNDDMLRRAFLSDTGLTSMTSRLMEAPSTSDQLDEFLLMCQLFPMYAADGGFFRVNVPDVGATTSTEQDAKKLLRTIRSWAEKLTFLSTAYNAAKMPTFAKREELVFITSPEVNAAIDVEALAAAFNMSKAEISFRTVTVPKENFGLADCVGIITTEDFFMVYDTILTNNSQINPAGLYVNHFLHHHQVISASRFVPAIMLTTGKGDDVVIMRTPVTGISDIKAYDRDGAEIKGTTEAGKLERGQMYVMESHAITAPADGDNLAVVWSITGNNSPSTFITQEGVLHVSITDTAEKIKVKASTEWINDIDPRRDSLETEREFSLKGDVGTLWPVRVLVKGLTVKGVAVENFDEKTLTYSVAVPGGTVTASDVVFDGPSPADVRTTVATDGKSFTSQVMSAAGDPVYNVTVTAAP